MKKKVSQVNKDMEERKRNFLKDYEAAVLPLQDKYLLQLVPIIRYTEKGAFPVFALDVYHPHNAPLDTQSETNTGADSDTETPQQ